MNTAYCTSSPSLETTLVPPAGFPACREAVTPDWVRETLADHPRFSLDPIRTVELTDLGDGLGQLSALTLAGLTCASGRRGQLVIKLHAPVPDMHQVALNYGHYENEVRFYAEMAQRVPMRTPEIYVSAMDPVHNRVVIVMEGFGAWHSPDQIAGATAREVSIAVGALAGLAATFWDAPPRETFPWLRAADSPAYASLPQDYAACLPGALERFESIWPEGSARTLARIARGYGGLREAVLTRTQVLSHWDYRVENLFFGTGGELAVIDWQLMCLDSPAHDLAYLLATNVETALRREIEAEMMALYLRRLRQHGVTGYGEAELIEDYRRALLSVSVITVIGGANADIENARSQALFARMGSRLLAAIDDWQATEVLDGRC
ncbi:MAG: aminoglycoside phosphotransferase family protein [Pseudomonadales bacterium]